VFGEFPEEPVGVGGGEVPEVDVPALISAWTVSRLSLTSACILLPHHPWHTNEDLRKSKRDRFGQQPGLLVESAQDKRGSFPHVGVGEHLVLGFGVVRLAGSGLEIHRAQFPPSPAGLHPHQFGLEPEEVL
jgi:hypothetical protein